MEVYAVSGPNNRPDLRLVESRQMKPLDYVSWEPQLRNVYDTVAITLAHPDVLSDRVRNNSFLADEWSELIRERGDELLPFFSDQALRLDFTRAERSGLGYSRALDPGVTAYGIKVFPTRAGDTLYIDLDVVNYQPAALPELSAQWLDRIAELSWRTKEFREAYYGWDVQKSVAGGPFVPLFERPLQNQGDTINGGAMPVVKHKDYLDNNTDTIRYRLRGMDYFGHLSETYKEIKGTGLGDITVSPALIKAEQTDSNYAQIAWEFPAEQEGVLQEFRLIHSPVQGADYVPAVVGIPPDQRELAFPMQFEANYYRLQAVSTSGTVYTSFESLVMSYDTVPPADPRGFSGTMDTSGVATLTWEPTDEEDLDGYYLFKGFYRYGELQRVNQETYPGPSVLDTTALEQTNDTVYYQLRAVDFRGNSSNFSPMVALKKPDIYPPAPARITSARNNGRVVTLEWAPSPSDDAELYVLYRRDVDDGGAFEPVLRWSTENYIATYRDSLVEPGRAYAYTLEVTDDDGLVSERPRPVGVRVKDYGLQPPIDVFTATPRSAEGTVLLSWDYSVTPREYHIYRATEGETVALLKVVDGEAINYLDEGTRKGRNYRYLMKAVFANGKVSPFTAEVGVLLE